MKMRTLTFVGMILAASIVNAQIGFMYDAATGDLNLDAMGNAITTLEVKSDSGMLTGAKADFAHFGGMFDVYTANKAFKMDPAGFGDTVPFLTLAPGLTDPGDLAVSGSILGMGAIVDVTYDGFVAAPAFCDGSTAGYCFDFDAGAPTDLAMFGTAEARPDNGNPNGYLSITDAANSQRGAASLAVGADNSLIFAGRTGGANAAHHIDNIEVTVNAPTDFSVAADLRVGGGTDNPADGFSFSFVQNTDPWFADNDTYAGMGGEASLPEEGTRSGLSVGFDEWQSGPVPVNGDVDGDGVITAEENPEGNDVIGLSVRLNGDLIAQIPLPTKNGAVDDPTSLATGDRGPGGPGDISALGWAKLELGRQGNDVVVSWKGVETVVTIPEPASLTLLGLAGMMLFGFARRRK